MEATTFEVEINLDELLAFQQALDVLPERVQEVTVETMREVEDMAYLELSEYGEPPTYPIPWVSERQKRAFFASNGFGGGIPHERNGALPDSFEEAEVMASAGLVEGKVYSVAEWAHFVMGKDQSPIHQGRWRTDEQIAVEITPEVRELFASNYLRAIQEALSAK